MEIVIERADLEDSAQAQALVEIIDAYARGPGGQDAQLSDLARSNLVKGLQDHPSAMVLLAFLGGQPVGTAVCIFSFSTFIGRPIVNIHDFAVLPGFRSRGIGRALLTEVEHRARERDCCRITLEVNDSNDRAKKLYESVGFGPWTSPTLFVTKAL